MKIENEVGVQGFYNLVVRKADGSIKQDYGWQPNLILDIGLNAIGGTSLVNACFVGSGSNAPLVSNTALQNPVASTDTVQANATGYSEVAPYYGWIRRTFRFLNGSAAGNLSEVGVGGNYQDSVLFSRALILDGSGNPTTITVLGDETLDVTYELRVYAPTADATFNLTLAGVVYACRMRPSQVNTQAWAPQYLFEAASSYGFYVSPFDGDIGTTLEAPNGNSVSQVTADVLAYANNSRKRQYKFDADLNDFNLEGGIKSILYSAPYRTLGQWQCSFTPKIPKDAAKKLSLTLEISWNRFTPA